MWKPGDRVEIPYTNPYLQPFKEGVVEDVFAMRLFGSDELRTIVAVREIHRNNGGLFFPENLKPWAMEDDRP